MQINKEIGGTVIRRFVNQELQKTGKLSSQGVAFLANVQSRLGMPQEVTDAKRSQRVEHAMIIDYQRVFARRYLISVLLFLFCSCIQLGNVKNEDRVKMRGIGGNAVRKARRKA